MATGDDGLTQQIIGALRDGALEISAFQAYGNGTVQLTLKPPRAARGARGETDA